MFTHHTTRHIRRLSPLLSLPFIFLPLPASPEQPETSRVGSLLAGIPFRVYFPAGTTFSLRVHAPSNLHRATPFTFNARNHPAPNSRALIRVLSLIARPRPTAHRPAPIGLLQHTIPITSPRNHCSTSSAPRYRSLTAPRITSARVSTATLPSDSSAKAPRYSWAPRPCF